MQKAGLTPGLFVCANTTVLSASLPGLTRQSSFLAAAILRWVSGSSPVMTTSYGARLSSPLRSEVGLARRRQQIDRLRKHPRSIGGGAGEGGVALALLLFALQKLRHRRHRLEPAFAQRHEAAEYPAHG